MHGIAAGSSRKMHPLRITALTVRCEIKAPHQTDHVACGLEPVEDCKLAYVAVERMQDPKIHLGAGVGRAIYEQVNTNLPAMRVVLGVWQRASRLASCLGPSKDKG